jgi:hypothetical protein
MPASDAADAHALAILDQVELHSLTATPGTIAPFAASKIAWNVSGPAGFTLRLDSAQVPKVGSKLVTPINSHDFQLKALAGRFTQPLGTVVVSVDQSVCRIAPIPNTVILQTVAANIEDILSRTMGASRRRPDILTMDETGIGIDLAFTQKVKVYPDPDVDIRAHWHYRLFGGQLEDVMDSLSVKVKFASWLWALPWNYPGLPLAKAIAEDNLRTSITLQAADGAAAIESMVPHGTRIVSVQHTPTNFEPFVCPDLALHALLAAGAAVAGEISARRSGGTASK